MTKKPFFQRCPLLLSATVGAALLLSGCVSTTEHGSIVRNDTPHKTLADYSSVACDGLWREQSSETNENPVYWLRLMECAQTLTVSQARGRALGYSVSEWHGTLKHSILLQRAEATGAERRQMLERLNIYQPFYPEPLHPLISLWRANQQHQLALIDERAYAQRQRESSENQLETLQVKERQLHAQLSETTRKLENLTDIERKLSSRKTLPTELPSDEMKSDDRPEAEVKPVEELNRDNKTGASADHRAAGTEIEKNNEIVKPTQTPVEKDKAQTAPAAAKP